MIIVLSPAKTLDYEFESNHDYSVPAFLSQSSKLINNLKTKEPKDIASLMGLSDKLAALNFDRSRSVGYRLNIAAGTAVRFEPGVPKTVELVEFVECSASAVARPAAPPPTACTSSCSPSTDSGAGRLLAASAWTPSPRIATVRNSSTFSCARSGWRPLPVTSSSRSTAARSCWWMMFYSLVARFGLPSMR